MLYVMGFFLFYWELRFFYYPHEFLPDLEGFCVLRGFFRGGLDLTTLIYFSWFLGRVYTLCLNFFVVFLFCLNIL